MKYMKQNVHCVLNQYGSGDREEDVCSGGARIKQCDFYKERIFEERNPDSRDHKESNEHFLGSLTVKWIVVK